MGVNRDVHRRLVGLAAVDPDFEVALLAREQRRAGAIRTLVTRLSERDGQPAPAPAPAQLEGAVRHLLALTSFATNDALTGPDHDPRPSPSWSPHWPAAPSPTITRVEPRKVLARLWARGPQRRDHDPHGLEG